MNMIKLNATFQTFTIFNYDFDLNLLVRVCTCVNSMIVDTENIKMFPSIIVRAFVSKIHIFQEMIN